MKMVLVAASVAALGLGTAFAPSQAHAANANNPYGNVDHRNDMGNDTGDSQVEGLNAQQLDENYRGPVQMRPPAGAPVGAPMVVPAQPPPGMPPPPPPGTVVR
ncbi:MAG TPA: hypothetical protein VGM42_03370 [Rhodopila sp.]|jgi:hypothetical protein